MKRDELALKQIADLAQRPMLWDFEVRLLAILARDAGITVTVERYDFETHERTRRTLPDDQHLPK